MVVVIFLFLFIFFNFRRVIFHYIILVFLFLYVFFFYLFMNQLTILSNRSFITKIRIVRLTIYIITFINNYYKLTICRSLNRVNLYYQFQINITYFHIQIQKNIFNFLIHYTLTYLLSTSCFVSFGFIVILGFDFGFSFNYFAFAFIFIFEQAIVCFLLLIFLK